MKSFYLLTLQSKKYNPFRSAVLSILIAASLTTNQTSAQTLSWAKQLGGTSGEEGRSITTDAASNVYTVGYFGETTDFDPGPGTHNLTSAGSNDVFVTKLDAAGDLVWAKQFGGTGNNHGFAIATDTFGNVYSTGFFAGTVDFDPGPGAFYLASYGNNDVFISKLDTDGNFIWAKQFGGTSTERGYALTTDASGNVYTTGYFAGTCDFDPSVAFLNLTPMGSGDSFVCKLDPAGNLVWVKQLGGTGANFGNAIATDPSGNVYSTGRFTGTTDFDPSAGTYSLTSNGSTDVFVSKLDADGNFVWANHFGGTGVDIGLSIALDNFDNVLTTGVFEDTVDFNPDTSTTNLVSAGDRDVFVSKLDAAGTLVWAKQLGGTDYDEARSITTDTFGDIYTTGQFEGTSDFDPGAGIYDLTSAGGRDIFISKLDADGNFEWAKNMGGTSDDIGSSIATDGIANVYTTGNFQGTADFDPNAGTFNLSTAESFDAFVHKLNQCNNPIDVSVTNNSPTLAANSSVLNYQWLDCDNNFTAISGEVGQNFTAFANGNYAVEVTGVYCRDTSACEAVNSVTILENGFENDLILFPNPTDGQLTVRLGAMRDDVTATVRTIFGQEVSSNHVTRSDNLELIVPGEPGIYLIEISSENKKTVFKVVKE